MTDFEKAKDKIIMGAERRSITKLRFLQPVVRRAWSK